MAILESATITQFNDIAKSFAMMQIMWKERQSKQKSLCAGREKYEGERERRGGERDREKETDFAFANWNKWCACEKTRARKRGSAVRCLACALPHALPQHAASSRHSPVSIIISVLNIMQAAGSVFCRSKLHAIHEKRTGSEKSTTAAIDTNNDIWDVHQYLCSWKRVREENWTYLRFSMEIISDRISLPSQTATECWNKFLNWKLFAQNDGCWAEYMASVPDADQGRLYQNETFNIIYYTLLHKHTSNALSLLNHFRTYFVV